jgi:hypothetical protein
MTARERSLRPLTILEHHSYRVESGRGPFDKVRQKARLLSDLQFRLKPATTVLHPIEGTPDRAIASLGLTGPNGALMEWSNRRNQDHGEFTGAHHRWSHP